MSKWIEARVVHLKDGQAQEIEDDERVISATFETPHIWLVVVKERPALYNKDDTGAYTPDMLARVIAYLAEHDVWKNVRTWPEDVQDCVEWAREHIAAPTE